MITAPKSIIVASSLNQDISISVDKAPGPGQTVLGGDVFHNLGGKGANTAIAAARAGGSVRLAAAVGRDAAGDALTAQVASAGVDVSLIRHVDGVTTGTAYIVIDADGENRIIVAPGANFRFGESADDSFWNALTDAVVVLHLEIPLDDVLRIAERAHDNGAFVLLNPSPANVNGDIGDVMKFVDLVIVNEIEVKQLGSDEADECAARTLAERCSDCCVVVTRGKDDILVVENGDLTYVRTAPARQVRDTTAAGDTLTGFLAFGLAAGKSVREALETAVVAASLTVESPGASVSIPLASDVRARAAELADDS